MGGLQAARKFWGFYKLKSTKYRDFNKLYAKIQKDRIAAYTEFKKDVVTQKFPSGKHSVSVDQNELLLFKKFLNKN